MKLKSPTSHHLIRKRNQDTLKMTYRPHKHIPDKERVIAGYKVSLR